MQYGAKLKGHSRGQTKLLYFRFWNPGHNGILEIDDSSIFCLKTAQNSISYKAGSAKPINFHPNNECQMLRYRFIYVCIKSKKIFQYICNLISLFYVYITISALKLITFCEKVCIESHPMFQSFEFLLFVLWIFHFVVNFVYITKPFNSNSFHRSMANIHSKV